VTWHSRLAAQRLEAPLVVKGILNGEDAEAA
jgi:hypothetical protein